MSHSHPPEHYAVGLLSSVKTAPDVENDSRPVPQEPLHQGPSPFDNITVGNSKHDGIGKVVLEGGKITSASLRPGESFADRLVRENRLSARMLGELIRLGKQAGDGIWTLQSLLVESGALSTADLEAIARGLKKSGFTLWFDELDQRDEQGHRVIFGGLRDFQEHLGGELCVTYPQGIGARFEVNQIDLALMEEAVQELRRFAHSHPE